MMKNYMNTIAKVVERIGERKRLLLTFVQEHEGLEKIGEGSTTLGYELCLNEPSSPDKALFVCDSTFTCPDNQFNCTSTRSVISYSDCSGSNNSHECNNESGFSCSLGGADADYFSCDTFECGSASGARRSSATSSYTCPNIDFLCGGPEYDCQTNFQCTAGHVFACTQTNNCQADFDCSAGTECGQPGASTHSCTLGGAVAGYDAGTAGGTGPGDFLCGGLFPDGSETFNCDLEFTCNATSDFACVSGGDNFTCTGSSSDFGSFECDSTFACYVAFSCQMVVTCGSTPATSTYQCPPGVNYNRQE